MGNVVLWEVIRPPLLTRVCYCYSVCGCEQKAVFKVKCESSDMSGDCCHPDGPDAHLLVSLHKLLQAGQGADAAAWHVGELQLRLSRLPPLHRALLLTGLGGRVAEGEGEAVAVAHAGGGEYGGGRGEAARVGLLGVGGGAAAGAFWGDLFGGASGQ